MMIADSRLHHSKGAGDGWWDPQSIFQTGQTNDSPVPGAVLRAKPVYRFHKLHHMEVGVHGLLLVVVFLTEPHIIHRLPFATKRLKNSRHGLYRNLWFDFFQKGQWFYPEPPDFPEALAVFGQAV